MLCLVLFLIGVSSKKDCVALGELWSSPMEQLGNKAGAGLCISQCQLGSSSLVWLEKVSAFSGALFIFNLLPHLGTAPSLVTCICCVVPSIYQSYAKKLHIETVPFSELPWRCDHSFPFAVLENVCLQQVITRMPLWYLGTREQCLLLIRWNCRG